MSSVSLLFQELVFILRIGKILGLGEEELKLDIQDMIKKTGKAKLFKHIAVAAAALI